MDILSIDACARNAGIVSSFTGSVFSLEDSGREAGKEEVIVMGGNKMRVRIPKTLHSVICKFSATGRAGVHVKRYRGVKKRQYVLYSSDCCFLVGLKATD